MLPTFVSLVQQARSTVIHISVYYTRAIISGDPSKLYSYLPPNIVLAPGRPRISAILEKTIDQVSVSSCSGFVVGVCGPVSLGEHVRKAVGELDSDRINAVNGVELCEECVYLLLTLSMTITDWPVQDIRLVIGPDCTSLETLFLVYLYF